MQLTDASPPVFPNRLTHRRPVNPYQEDAGIVKTRISNKKLQNMLLGKPVAKEPKQGSTGMKLRLGIHDEYE
jgi:hypothetical protein